MNSYLESSELPGKLAQPDPKPKVPTTMNAIVLKSCSIIFVALVGLGCAGSGRDQNWIAGETVTSASVDSSPDDRVPSSTSIPGSATALTAVPIPAGTLDGRPIAPFFIAETEITWDQYLALVTEADDADAAEGIDGYARPSKPYISMDRGFGQQERPVISISARGAEAYAAWLNARTGPAWRLPTADEWRYTAALSLGSTANALSQHAWHAGNANGKTAPVGTSRPDALGLYDVLGNAAEWCTDGEGGYVLAGGSYRDPAATLGTLPLVEPSPTWNASDPQIPKSTWWLADAGFTGLRLVHE